MFLCRLSPLCCGYCAVFPTLDFILVICYLFIFFEIPILILVFVWNYCNVHSEPTQTFKMEFFGGNSLVNCWEPLTNFAKSSIVDVWLYWYHLLKKKILGDASQAILHPPFVSGKRSLKLLVTFPSSVLAQTTWLVITPIH